MRLFSGPEREIAQIFPIQKHKVHLFFPQVSFHGKINALLSLCALAPTAGSSAACDRPSIRDKI